MNEERKDLEYFKKQVSEKNGYGFLWHFGKDAKEVCELYAEHHFLQGKHEGEANVKSVVEAKMPDAANMFYTKGWNEALHWAAEETQIDFVVGNDLKQSILNGLKEE